MHWIRKIRMKTIKGRTAFLTGAASGIGRSLATALAAEGCHLYLVDVDENGLRSLEQELASALAAQRMIAPGAPPVDAVIVQAESVYGLREYMPLALHEML